MAANDCTLLESIDFVVNNLTQFFLPPHTLTSGHCRQTDVWIQIYGRGLLSLLEALSVQSLVYTLVHLFVDPSVSWLVHHV